MVRAASRVYAPGVAMHRPYLHRGARVTAAVFALFVPLLAGCSTGDRTIYYEGSEAWFVTDSGKRLAHGELSMDPLVRYWLRKPPVAVRLRLQVRNDTELPLSLLGTTLRLSDGRGLGLPLASAGPTSDRRDFSVQPGENREFGLVFESGRNVRPDSGEHEGMELSCSVEQDGVHARASFGVREGVAPKAQAADGAE